MSGNSVATRVEDGIGVFVVLSLIGFPAIVVFVIGAWFLLWVLRLVIVTWVAAAIALRWLVNVVRAE